MPFKAFAATDLAAVSVFLHVAMPVVRMAQDSPAIVQFLPAALAA